MIKVNFAIPLNYLYINVICQTSNTLHWHWNAYLHNAFSNFNLFLHNFQIMLRTIIWTNIYFSYICIYIWFILLYGLISFVLILICSNPFYSKNFFWSIFISNYFIGVKRIHIFKKLILNCISCLIKYSSRYWF